MNLSGSKITYISEMELTRMNHKATMFIEELKVLCKKHGVQITASMHDSIQFWDLNNGDDPIYGPVEDMTKETKTCLKP